MCLPKTAASRIVTTPWRVAVAALVFVACGACGACGARGPRDASSPESPPAGKAPTQAELYTSRPGTFRWLTSEGRPTPQAHEALRLIGGARTDGLDPADYDAPALAATAATLDTAAATPAATAAAFEAQLTQSVVRYYRDLHLGRVDPQTLGLQMATASEAHDFHTVLESAITANRVAAAAADLEPPLAQYAALKAALARYRTLPASAGEPPRFDTTLHPGDPLTDSGPLRRVLTLAGDLAPNADLPATSTYDESTSQGVMRFQARHGLTPDGVIGAATARALAVPFTWRVRQIELALERLRWLPDLSGGRLIAVNVPMFRLWAWDAVPSAAPPALDMAVVVGRALDTRTPIFADRLEYVIFRPYWNVPASILRKEVAPAARKDAGYLAREDMEIVDGPADRSPVVPASSDTIAALGRSRLRVRQRPGSTNALGLVKFMFPNQNDVYMHGTPATQLFARDRRDLSHGCIRVADPVALAAWVLGPDPAWTRDRIVAAMHGADNQRVDLPHSIQVVIFYTTAVVTPDGLVHFAEDVYGQDGPLDRAL